jgi:hypothetical protein
MRLKFVHEKLKAQRELPFWNAKMDSKMAGLWWIHCLA